MKINLIGKTKTAFRWLKFIFLYLLLGLALYYFIFGALTVSLLIEAVRYFLNLNRPFSDERVIAAMGACAFVWWRVRPKVAVWSLSLKLKEALKPVIYLFLFFLMFFTYFVPDRSAILHQTIGKAMEKVLAENGYCVSGKTHMPNSGVRCSEKSQVMIDNLGFIAGGVRYRVYGVSDPIVLTQIKKAYVDAFLKTPALRHVIVYFDPNPRAQAQSQSKDDFIEMRR